MDTVRRRHDLDIVPVKGMCVYTATVVGHLLLCERLFVCTECVL